MLTLPAPSPKAILVFKSDVTSDRLRLLIIGSLAGRRMPLLAVSHTDEEVVGLQPVLPGGLKHRDGELWWNCYPHDKRRRIKICMSSEAILKKEEGTVVIGGSPEEILATLRRFRDLTEEAIAGHYDTPDDPYPRAGKQIARAEIERPVIEEPDDEQSEAGSQTGGGSNMQVFEMEGQNGEAGVQPDETSESDTGDEQYDDSSHTEEGSERDENVEDDSDEDGSASQASSGSESGAAGIDAPEVGGQD